MVPEEKKAMLQEIANQKGVSCRAQGWKVHLCAAQLLQLVGRILVVVMYCCRGEQMLEAFAFIEYFLLSNSEAFPINKGHAEFLCVTYNNYCIYLRDTVQTYLILVPRTKIY